MIRTLHVFETEPGARSYWVAEAGPTIEEIEYDGTGPTEAEALASMAGQMYEAIRRERRDSATDVGV